MITQTAKGRWQVRVEVKRVFDTDAEARRFERLSRMHLSAAQVQFDGGGDSPSIVDGMDAWLADLADNGATEGHVEKCRRVLARIAVELTDQLGEITKQTLRKWRHTRRRLVKTGTVNGELSVLKAFANWCVDENLWEPSSAGIRWLTMRRLEDNPKQPDPVTPSEFGKLLDVLPEQVRNLWLSIGLCADRPGALYAAEWKDVHLPDLDHGEVSGFMSLRERKGGPKEARNIPFDAGSPLHELLIKAKAFFCKVRGRAPRLYDPVFITGRSGQRWNGPTFNSALRWHLRKHGKKLRNVYPYLARHSIITYLAGKGLNAHQIMSLTGHHDFRSTNKYIHMCGVQSVSYTHLTLPTKRIV